MKTNQNHAYVSQEKNRKKEDRNISKQQNSKKKLTVKISWYYFR